MLLIGNFFLSLQIENTGSSEICVKDALRANGKNTKETIKT